MSVLNDVSVQDGAAIRELCAGLHNSDAEGVLDIIKEWKGPRMDSTELSLDPADDTQNAVRLANAHWKTPDGHFNWGNFKGTWKSFVSYVLQSSRFWTPMKDRYMPSTKVEQCEDDARALLSATYYFPFTMKEEHADLCTKHLVWPVLKRLPKKRIHMGSNAVSRLILMAENAENNGLGLFHKSVDQLCDFNDFNQYMSYWCVGTSTNFHEALYAAKRASTVDQAWIDKSDPYLCLAGLANFCQAWMNNSGRNSRIGRKVRRINTRANSDKAVKQACEANGTVFVPLHDPEAVYRQYRSSTGDLVGKIAMSKRFSCVASYKLVLVRFGNENFLLTRQDLLSLKFSSMSHAMWHFYAGSIKMEYYDPDVVQLHTPDPDSEDLVNLAGVVADELADFTRRAAEAAGQRRGQKLVDYDTVKEKLDLLWRFYREVLTSAVLYGSQDYLGRYLDQLFAIYTSTLGGDLMAESIPQEISDMNQEYSKLGFSVHGDLMQLLSIFDGMPMSAIQDFGRLAKIVSAYDVNPIYSFLDRASKMNTPNPRGKAKMKGLFDLEIEEMNDVEKADSEVRLRACCRVLLAKGDVVQRILDNLTGQEKEEAKNDSLPALIARMKRLKREINTAVRWTIDTDLMVPEAEVDNARKQAKQLVLYGSLPTNPYAGAFLDTAGILSYSVRAEPDIAILKPTATVPSDLQIALSNLSGIPRATPTRKNDGYKEKGSGTMITDFLKDKFPSRSQALAFVSVNAPVASTSDKIETNKYPKKTRIITAMCSEGRRIQGEYEYNNGKVLVHVPGFMVGITPSDRLKRTYAALKDDIPDGYVRLFGSLDLSSFSTGMWWDIQHTVNSELGKAYDLDDKYIEMLERCTLGTYMIRSDCNIRLFTVNSMGANYEGLDGKRNTFMHCALWYMARCNAYDRGLKGSMRAFLYIDDGAFAIEIPDDEIEKSTRILREALIETYTEYGLKLNLSKTVISTSYMQFLNELFLHGIHIGYGFRALCHTAAQSFPEAATIREELAVITGGIKGAGVSGGVSIRLLSGYNYILWLYMAGVVGSKGRALASRNAYLISVLLYTPSIAGGWNLPNWTELFSNLAGHRDVEKLDRISSLGYLHRVHYPSLYAGYTRYVVAAMTKPKLFERKLVPDRVTIAHPGTAIFGDLGRDMDIAIAAEKMSTNREATALLREFVATKGKPNSSGFTGIMSKAMQNSPVKLPMTLVEKALNGDPAMAVITMVKKIASSYLIARMLTGKEIRAYNSAYRRVGRTVVETASLVMTD